MSKAAKQKTTREPDIETIEERATDVDRLGHELFLAGERLSAINNQLHHFLKPSQFYPKWPEAKTLLQKYRRIAKRALAWPDEPTCLMCHCTEYNACEGGCSWLFQSKENNWGVCSAHFDTLAVAEDL